MSEPTPKQPFTRTGRYVDEVGVFSDINAVSKSFATKKLRYSRTSPPLIKDVPEGEMILDKTLLRVYITVDGTLRYFALT